VLDISNSHGIGTDGLNPIIIKNNAMLLSKQLCYIVNISFNTGFFPNLLKNAIVVPVYKAGCTSDPENYHPISILTIFSKIIEKLFYKRLIGYVNTHNIYFMRINLDLDLTTPLT